MTAAMGTSLDAGAGPQLQRWTLHDATQAQDDDAVRLFEQVFGHPMSLEHWRWKYQDAPLRGMLLRREGEAVAFYGGMPRAVQGPDRVYAVVQNGDVMVRPDERAIFTRKGALYSVGQAYISRFIGPGRAFEFAYGFPSDRHFALGEKLGLYVEGDRMQKLSWPAVKSKRAPLLVREQPLGEAGLDVLGPLWEAMKRDWQGLYIPVRDAARWRMRFLQRPGFRYDLLLVRRRLGGRPLAALALREEQDHVKWLDFVGSRAGIEPALAAARRWTAQRGGKPLVALCSHAIAADFSIEGASVEPSGIVVPLRTPEPDWPQPYPWHHRLWLMGGDSDFM